MDLAKSSGGPYFVLTDYRAYGDSEKINLAYGEAKLGENGYQ